MDLALSGLASGFDWKTVVEQLADVERAPQRRLRNEQTKLNQKKDAVAALVNELGTLQTRAEALKDSSLYSKKLATSSDQEVATATAATTAAQASYTFVISKLATESVQKGATNVGGGVSTTAAVTSSAAGFGITVTTGTFSVNGTQITVNNTKTLTDLLSEIETAIGGGATANYNSGTDRVEIDSPTNQIVLGSAGDTSNFLQATRLFNTDTTAPYNITSTGEVGGINLGGTLASELGVTAGTTAIKINGVEIEINSADTVAATLTKITNSNAGVTASYDSVNDRFLLTNKTTGNMGFVLDDNTSNFLAQSKLLTSAGATLDAGDDAEFTVNGGGTILSRGNSLTSDSHGIQGLTVTALATGTSVIKVANDTASLKSAITSYVDQYNKVQTFIDNQTASTTDADGKVTAGTLATDTTVIEVASRLRRETLTDGPSGLTEIKRLESLGFKGSGFSNKLALDDSAKFDEALEDSLDEIETFFTDTTNGVATRLDRYLDSLVEDEDGTLVNHRDNFSKQSKRIDEQIVELEKLVQSNKERLTRSFIEMEKAQSRVNQQMQFLASRFK